MQIGIRLHDVNTALGPEMKTMEARARTAAEEGFSCVHLDLAKVISGSVYQVLTYLPKFMSTVVMTSLVTMLVKQGSLTSGMGIISQFLSNVGLISKEVANAGLLNNPAYFRSIYQISGIWESAGYDSIVFFAAIIAISPTSYEAAQIDGADKMAQMRYVVLPSILSTIVIMLITRIGSLLSAVRSASSISATAPASSRRTAPSIT